MDIATRIRTARNERQISQRAFAKAMKVTPSAVAQWETGATTPKVPKRAEISRYLGIPFVELMPEAEGLAEISVKDPHAVLLVRQFLELPESIREAILMQVAATAESLRGNRGK